VVLEGVFGGVELQDLVDAGLGPAPGQLIGQAARLIGLHLLLQVEEHLFEVRRLVRLNLQHRHHADHVVLPRP